MQVQLAAPEVDDAKLYVILAIRGTHTFDEMRRFLDAFSQAGFHVSSTTTRLGTENLPMSVEFAVYQPVWMEGPEAIVDYIVQYFELKQLKVKWRPVYRDDERLFDGWRMERGSYFMYPQECRLKVADVSFNV